MVLITPVVHMGQWRDMFEGELDVAEGGIGQTPEGQDPLSPVPAKRGVLLLLDSHDKPIVLLPAASMRSRLSSRLSEPIEDKRSRTADLRAVTRKILWKRSDSHFETDLDYLELARKIHPDSFAGLLAWKPPWFVHVDVEAKFPRFSRTREVGGSGGEYLGPFMSGRDCERFISVLQDAFDLCRDYRCLRQAPNGSPCSYGQMGRCASPCDGSISMDAYREMVNCAAAYVVDRKGPLLEELRQKIRQASKDLQFEQAADYKSRLDRLAELDSPAYYNVAPLDRFRFAIIQRGGSTRKAKAFIAAGGEISPPTVLNYPLVAEEIEAFAKRSSAQSTSFGSLGPTERLRMGLVARYLFSSAQRRGLIRRLRDETTAQGLAKAIESSTDILNLRAPKPRKKKQQSEPKGKQA